jgi:hypothetical protein
MPISTTQQAARGALTPGILLRILRDLIDVLSRDMQITQARRTPAGVLFTLTSRTRPGQTHQVCRRHPTPGRPQPTYSCNCEHGLQIEEFTLANRHAHCWHVRFVHFLTLPTPARRHLLTCTTGLPAITDQQRALRAAWAAYLGRRRAELQQPPDQRPSTAFVYRLVARQRGSVTAPLAR